MILLAEASDSAAEGIVSPEIEFGLKEKAFEALEMGLIPPEKNIDRGEMKLGITNKFETVYDFYLRTL